MLLPPIRSVIRATVITDASFCPGSKAAGWAAWIRIDGEAAARKHSGVLPRDDVPNSTAAEVMAAGNGIYLAAAAGAKDILIQSDCMAVIHLIGGQTQSETLLKLWRHLLDFDVMEGVVVEARHVKGHGVIKDARTYVNAWCDKHARQEMEKVRGPKHLLTGEAFRQKSRGKKRSKTKNAPRRFDHW